jgi:hypothetical protein
MNIFFALFGLLSLLRAERERRKYQWLRRALAEIIAAKEKPGS